MQENSPKIMVFIWSIKEQPMQHSLEVDIQPDTEDTIPQVILCTRTEITFYELWLVRYSTPQVF
jgi:hypothetical protein